VTLLAMMVFTVTPMDSTIWSRNARCTSVNFSNEASSITASGCASNRTGSTISEAGDAEPRPVEIGR